MAAGSSHETLIQPGKHGTICDRPWRAGKEEVIQPDQDGTVRMVTG